MKKIFLFSLLLLSTQLVAQNFDDLVSRTMNGKLIPYDFNNSSDYLINVDTLSRRDNPIILIFNNKINAANGVNQLSNFLKDGKIIDTQVFLDIVPNLEKYHVMSRFIRHNKVYAINWWFQGNDDKLSAVTISKR